MSDLNVGNIDRALRIVIGLALLALTTGGVVGAWGWVGVVPLATGVIAKCPLYSMLGIATTSR